MDNELAMMLYEEGRAVGEIAEAMGTDPSEVTALLSKSDDTQTVQVNRQGKHIRDLRRVRALADSMTRKYLEALNAVIDDPDSTADEKANAFGEMDKVIRISKLSSDQAEEVDREQIGELRATTRLIINGKKIPGKGLFTANPAPSFLKAGRLKRSPRRLIKGCRRLTIRWPRPMTLRRCRWPGTKSMSETFGGCGRWPMG